MGIRGTQDVIAHTDDTASVGDAPVQHPLVLHRTMLPCVAHLSTPFAGTHASPETPGGIELIPCAAWP